MKFDPSNRKSQKTKKSILAFEDGDAELWCEWPEQLQELYWLIQLTTAEQTSKQAKAIVSLLHGKAVALYLTHQSRLEREQADNLVDSLDDASTAEDILVRSLDWLAKEFFPIKHAYSHQTFYVRYHLFIGGENTIRQFDMMRLNSMNNHLLYFPTIERNDNKFNQCQVLGDDHLCDICWTNIVSTLLLLGIRSLNALLAHYIAVNTSYRSSLVLHTWAYKPLVVLDLAYSEKVRKAHFLLRLISRISSHSIVPIRVFS
jgi:hypothetical protein